MPHQENKDPEVILIFIGVDYFIGGSNNTSDQCGSWRGAEISTRYAWEIDNEDSQRQEPFVIQLGT